MDIITNLRKLLSFRFAIFPVFIYFTFNIVYCSTVQPAETPEIAPPPAVSYTYTGTRPIYPAVIYAINNGNIANWNESIISVAGPNTVIFNHVRVSDNLNLEDFSIRISLENNIITYRFYNIRQRPLTNAATPWKETNAFSQAGSEQILTEHFNKEIPKIMEDDALYAIARESANRRIRSSGR